MERIRFFLDEHIDPDIAAALQRHGIDALTTIEAGLRTAADERLWQFAQEQRRTLVTDDADFFRLATVFRDHHGVVFCRRHANSMRQIIRGLILIHEILSPREIQGRIEFL